MKKNHWKFLINRRLLLWLSVLGYSLSACNEKSLSEEVEDGLTPVIDMNYTVTKTSFSGKQTESPTVNKEKISMQIYENDDFRIRVDILDDEVDSYYKTEAQPGNDYPIPAYYEMMPGKYKLYDTKGNIMSENRVPELNFSGLVEQLQDATAGAAAIPAMVTGGMLYFPLDKFDLKPSGNNLRKAENDESQIFENTYTDEFDGLQYTQKARVRTSDQTIQEMALYDQTGKVLCKTSFLYEGEGDQLQLKNTQDMYLETNAKGEEVIYVTLAEYDNFTIALNFDN